MDGLTDGSTGDRSAPRDLRIAIPFATPVYGHLNGGHPLIAPLIAADRPGLRFLAAGSGAPSLAGVVASLDDARALADRLGDEAGADAVETYLHSRDIGSQALVPRDADLAFLHTAPLTLDALPWVLHFESVATLFWPFLHQGQCRDIALRDQPAYTVLRRVLEGASARALFTHCRHSARQIERIFPEPVAAKLRYAPLGVEIPDPWPARIAAAAAAMADASRPVEMLFTNSWHQAPENFYNRGGLDAVEAFLALHRVFPGVHLTLRTALPPEVRDGPLGRTILAHPAITLIDQPVSDDTLGEMLLAADIFLLPSASLHSVSLLRAMAFGAVPVVCDVPLVSEFVDDGGTGIVVPGRAATVLSIDPASGWEQEDYTTMRRGDRLVTDGLTAVLLDLCRDPERRRTLAAAGRHAAATRFAFAPFRDAFDDLLRHAAPAPSGRAAPSSLGVRLAERARGSLSLRRHPIAEEEPRAMTSYRDFNIVWYRGLVHGVRQGSGDVDLSAPIETLRQRLGPDDLVVAETLAELHARIDGLASFAAIDRLRADLAAASREGAIQREAITTLERRVDVLRHGPAGDPAAVVDAGAHGDFNLIWHGGRVLALRRGVEGLGPEMAVEALAERVAVGDALIADSPEQAVLLIDLAEGEAEFDALRAAFEDLRREVSRRFHGPAGSPDPVVPVDAHGGFNLFWHGGRVIAVRQAAGAFDPSADPADLLARIAPEDIVIAADEDVARCRIDLLNLEYQRPVNRLRRRLRWRARAEG